jgi:hypothetical protein
MTLIHESVHESRENKFSTLEFFEEHIQTIAEFCVKGKELRRRRGYYLYI